MRTPKITNMYDYFRIPAVNVTPPEVSHFCYAAKSFSKVWMPTATSRPGKKVQEPTITKDVSHEFCEHLLQIELHQPHCLHGVTFLLVCSAMTLLKQLEAFTIFDVGEQLEQKHIQTKEVLCINGFLNLKKKRKFYWFKWEAYLLCLHHEKQM